MIRQALNFLVEFALMIAFTAVMILSAVFVVFIVQFLCGYIFF